MIGACRSATSLQRQFFERYQTTSDCRVAEWLIKACLVTDTKAVSTEELARAASLLRQAQPTDWTYPYCQVAYALFDYRRDDFVSAIARAKHALRHSSMYPRLLARTITAMAQVKLQTSTGKDPQLIESLVRDCNSVLPDESNLFGEGDWHDWVYVRSLLKEAVDLSVQARLVRGGRGPIRIANPYSNGWVEFRFFREAPDLGLADVGAVRSRVAAGKQIFPIERKNQSLIAGHDWLVQVAFGNGAESRIEPFHRVALQDDLGTWTFDPRNVWEGGLRYVAAE